MKVSELGEFGLIDLLAKMIPDAPVKKPVIGIGDDAAAWHSDASIQLATVDTMVQNVHFSLDMMTWKELGWKSLAINLSDIAAMGGEPRYALVALALPEDTEVEDVVGLYEGMIELAGQYGTAIVGGNVSRSPVVSVTVTVLGDSLNDEILKRSTAAPGDIIAITGYPGSAAAGLEMLTKNLQFGAETADYLRGAFVRPRPRVKEGQLLLKQGVTTAIDTSDGLLADLRHVCEASGVGAEVNTGLLPIHPAIGRHFGERTLELALSGGEDYELLFTAKKEIVERVMAEMDYPVTAIGKITSGEAGQIRLSDADGKPVKINKTGWEHF
jgi:thiamine-monophosphate kinase